MRFFMYFMGMRFFLLIAGMFVFLVLSACAPDRSGARLVVGDARYAVPEQRPLGVLLAFEGADSLRSLYVQELEKAGVYRFHVESPTQDDLDAAVYLRIQVQSRSSEWAFWWYQKRVLARPFWPLMAYPSGTVLELRAEIWCRGSLQKTVHLIESDEWTLRDYEPYRQGLVQREVDWMHRMLATRFASELRHGDLEIPAGSVF